uniref:Gamma-soluble NSF attachment protein n=1 Tax=Cyprinus carpio carpio TaxID=630221 RepID=A0A9J7XXR3_CYPCA
MAQKINEAHEHIAKAEKYLKTSLMKWKPDYDSAASEYAKAAVCFKNARQLEQAKDAYLQEAEAHTGNRSLFHAAKAFEQAGMMLKDMQRLPEAVQYIEKASMMYVENGTPDTAAMALDRAGKLIEALDLAKAVHLYQQAAGVFENEDRLRQAVELVGKASRLLVRQQKKPSHKCWCICTEETTWRRRSVCGRATVSQDSAGARTAWPWSSFCRVTMSRMRSRCLASALHRCSDTWTTTFTHPFKSLYAKLAISLRVPGGGKKKAAAAAAASGDAGAAPPEEDEDEYAGGLC